MKVTQPSHLIIPIACLLIIYAVKLSPSSAGPMCLFSLIQLPQLTWRGKMTTEDDDPLPPTVKKSLESPMTPERRRSSRLYTFGIGEDLPTSLR